jgi:hypothetical protein
LTRRPLIFTHCLRALAVDALDQLGVPRAARARIFRQASFGRKSFAALITKVEWRWGLRDLASAGAARQLKQPAPLHRP